MRIFLTLMSKAKKVKRYRSGTIRRFMSKLTHVKFEKAIIRVEYGNQKDHRGKQVMFYNEGEYDNAKDAQKALRAFCEQ